MLSVFVIAILIGILSSMTGLGGGFIIVPTLVLLFNLPIKIAIGTSTLVITFVGLSSAISYRRKKLLDTNLVIPLAIGIIMGAQIGALLTAPIPGDVLKKLIGVLFIFISVIMILGRERNKEENYNISKALLIFFGFLIGIYSGLFGMGGGVLMVPLLNLLGVPILFSVSSSAIVTFFAGLSGATRHLLMDQVDIVIGLSASLGVIIGAQIGPNIAVKLKPNTLKSFFALMIAVIGVIMLIRP